MLSSLRLRLSRLTYNKCSNSNYFSSKSLSEMQKAAGFPSPPVFSDIEEDRLHRKKRLAAAFRLFSKFGYDEGVAGHITVRDPEHRETFWVNPFGVDFSQICVSNLIRCDQNGNVMEGHHKVNLAAFTIHSRIHLARPDVEAAAHSHSPFGRAWSTLGRKLDPITQDACAFYNDHSILDDYGGVVYELDEGTRISQALDKNKAIILKNHGLLTVGKNIDEAVWWYIAMDRSCHVQLLAEAACRHGDKPAQISEKAAQQAYNIVGNSLVGWFQFQPLYNRIIAEQPDLLK